LIVVLAAGVADAQAVSRRTLPKPADTVRVWADSPTLNKRMGVVRAVGPDSVIVGVRSSEGKGPFLDMPLATTAIRRIDLMTDRRPDQGRAFAFTVGGVLLGGIAGGMMGQRGDEVCDAGCEAAGGTRQEFTGGKTIIGALAGAGIGAVVGAYLGSQPIAKWSRIW
jgi:hypothetical protein